MLIGLEAECCRIVTKETEVTKVRDQKHHPDIGQWRWLMTMHYKLLKLYFDFFMICYHPEAPPGIRELPVKYNLPSRMFNCGIFRFLDLLRKLPLRLPHTSEIRLELSSFAYTFATCCESCPIQLASLGWNQRLIIIEQATKRCLH